MTATAKQPRTTTTRTAPVTLAEARAVERDADRSTRWTSVYPVPSRSVFDEHDVIADHRDDAWRCDCPAYIHRGRCRHITVARVAEAYHWWRRVLADTATPASECAAILPASEQQAAHGPDRDKGRGAVLAIAERINELDKEPA